MDGIIAVGAVNTTIDIVYKPAVIGLLTTMNALLVYIAIWIST